MKKVSLSKVLLSVLFCAASVAAVHAQTTYNTFSQGDNYVNLGVGIGDYLGGSGYSTVIPPISISYEKCVKDHWFDDKSAFGIGGYLGYASNKYNYSYLGDSYGWNYHYILLGVRGALHYQFVKKLDTYAGVLLGYNIVSSSYYGGGTPISSASAGGFLWSIYIGGRYVFNENFGVFAEVGYGIAPLQLGVTFRL